MKEAYVDTGLVNLAYFHFPHINDDSYLSALATECAGGQGEFWAYHDTLYVNQGSGGRGVERLEGFAEDLGLDMDGFTGCMEARTYDGVIQRDINLARQNEVSVTPTIFVLSADPNRTGTKFDGSPSFEDISRVIDELLIAPAPTPTATPLPPTPVPTPTPTPVSNDTSVSEPVARGWNVLGSPDAPVTLEDFTDFQ